MTTTGQEKSDLIASGTLYVTRHSKSFLIMQGIKQGLLYLLLSSISVIMLIPLVWMLSTSLKGRGLEFVFPPQWIPKPAKWSNYPEALTILPFGRFFLNTVIITFFSLVGSLISSSMVAFGFARIPFPGRKTLFMLLLSTMMLPYVVTLIPSFLLFKYLHWLDTFLPLTVPAFFGGGAFFIFLIRQFYATIPMDLDEAAVIDGAGYFRIWWSILLPLSRPVLATVAIFSFIWNWNDFMGPLIYLNSLEKFTLALGLASFHSMHNARWNLLMAASTVVLIPVLIVFFVAQRYFIQGIVTSGLAGR
ncbi:MAG: carbohydrate ABC transporter permease [Anaerolineae bacterium]|nr:carbohydrate ABC transporter permease [Anaerolineae bacterium]